ncbi:MAG: homocysteine S-methyltransferase family protein [Bacillota bacterium]|nr:homocysteine S-methyltransferase family protein [Bacillota bacterium]
MKFEQLLKSKKVLLIDGGMGTELAVRGCEMGGISNLTHPDSVREIHREYSTAGADIIITNTFTMNRISIEAHDSLIDVQMVNRAGVKIAREAVGKDKLVFGDLGPTGQLLEPYGNFTEEQFIKNYAEQAEIFDEEEVDGLIIETMSDLREAVCALKACKKVSSLPVIVSLAFSTIDKGGRTIMGSSVTEAAKAAEQYGAAAVGANCGDIDPAGMAEIVKRYRESTKLPIIVQPNAGRPKLINGKTMFDMSPDYYAAGVVQSVLNGASLVGGCCGTTPAHIGALSKSIEKLM